MTVGRDRHVGKNFTRELKSTTSVDEENSVLMIDTGEIVDLADNTKMPYAICFGDTTDPISLSIGNTVFLTGAQLDGEIPMFRSGWAEIPLDIDHSALIVGDMLIVGPADIGRVIKGDPTDATELLRRVGWCEEVIAAPGGGLRTKATVLCVLDMHNGAP